MKKFIFLNLIFLLFYNYSFSQNKPRGFSREPDIFITELATYFKSSPKKEIMKSFDRFANHWLQKDFNQDQQSIIIGLTEEMVIKDVQLSPGLENWLIAASAGIDSTNNISKEKYTQWLVATRNILRQNRKFLLPYLQFSSNFFDNRYLTKSQAKVWKVSSENFKFELQNNNVLLSFQETDLICNLNVDSIIISKTKGSYNLSENTWTGQGGIVDWRRVNLPKEDVFATLKDYSIDLSKAEFEAKNVELTYNGFLKQKVLGDIKEFGTQERSEAENAFEDWRYPQFNSYEGNLPLGELAKGRVRITGGIILQGKKLISQGIENKPAKVEIDYENKPKITATAERFVFTDKELRGKQIDIKILTDTNYISHPNINFSYLDNDKTLTLFRGNEGLEQAPFIDEYHNLELWVDQVIWKLDLPKIDLKMKEGDATAVFTSLDYFNDFDFEKLQSILSYNPLVKIQRYAMQNKNKPFTIDQYAQFLKNTTSRIKPQIINLNDLGFITYDPKTNIIKVLEKTHHFVTSAYRLKDFDIIKLESVISAKPNAYINLINNTLQLDGIQKTRFSDSQRVMIFPKDQQIRIGKNRKMKFDGLVRAGRIEFYGSQYEFDYELFEISSPTIDSMKIYFPEKPGARYLRPVKSVLTDINGVLHIDKSNNKSGKMQLEEYPYFDSKSGSKVVYDKNTVQNGAYKKDDFFFKVDPFKIESLDNFTIEGLTFPGVLKSAGILPDIEEEVRIMQDYSLGFEKVGNFPLYGGKGNGNLTVSLSEEGLWAKGSVDYEASSMQSDSIILLPKEMGAGVQNYSLSANDKYPGVAANNVTNTWKPYEGKMSINTNGQKVNVLKDGQTFEGNFIHSSEKLSGNGVLDWSEARLSSKLMHFGTNKVYSDTAAIEIRSLDPGKIAIKNSYVNIDIDFDTRIGQFKSAVAGSFTEMPQNLFATTMNHFKWNMDKKTIEFNKGPEITDEESYFITRKAEHQGLRFQSKKALFDMNEEIIYAEEIPFIDIADSRLFTKDGKATIKKEGIILPFEGAKILAARDNKYHELIDCRVKVHGRLNVSGNGFHEYKDKYFTKQKIAIDKITVTRDSQIYASSKISDSISFTISPKIAFHGLAEIYSQEEYLKWKGYVKPLHSFDSIKTQWISYKDQPNPKDVIIDISDPRTFDNRKVDVSLSLASDSVHIYPNWLNRKEKYNDLDIMIDTGIMFYDDASNEFLLGSKNRLLDNGIRGNYLSFNDKTLDIEAAGTLNFGLDFSEYFTAKSAGILEKNANDSVFTVTAFMALNALIPDECWERILAVVDKNKEGATSADLNDKYLKQAIAQFVDDKTLSKTYKNIDEDKINIPKELESSFVMNNLILNCVPSKNSFIANAPVDFLSINNKEINKSFDVKMEVSNYRRSTHFYFLLEVTKYDWFFFYYNRGNLFLYSTDNDFNLLASSKSRKVSEKGHTIRMASPRTVTRWLEKLEE